MEKFGGFEEGISSSYGHQAASIEKCIIVNLILSFDSSFHYREDVVS